MDTRRDLIVVIVLITIISLIIGFNLGAYVTIKSVVSIALNVGFVEVDEQLIEDALYRYNHHLKGCFNKT